MTMLWLLGPFALMLVMMAIYVQGQSRLLQHAPAAVNAYAAQAVPQDSARGFLLKLFLIAFVLRLAMVLLINSTDLINRFGLSSDSLKYIRMGEIIALQMHAGEFNWPKWIDSGWFQFNGFMVYLFGSKPFVIQLFNITAGSLLPVVIYKTVMQALHNPVVARWTALMVAIFPSFIYWSSLMLKDPISWLAVSLIVYGTVVLKQRFAFSALLSICIGLIIYLGIREYMFYISIIIITLAFFPLQRSSPSVYMRWLAVILLIGFAAQAAGFGFLAIDRISQSIYFDIDYLNHIRMKLSDHGSGRFFADESDAAWGQGVFNDVKAFLLAAYYSLLSLDLTNIGSVRQLMALPEVLLFIYLLPHLWNGFKLVWRKHRNLALPILGFSLGILVVYGSATTNKGALFRWRMQALPFMLMLITYGLYHARKGWFYRLLVRWRI